MKSLPRVILMILLGGLLFAPGAFAESGLVKISDVVYSYVGVKGASPANSFGANAGIIIGKDYIVAVDSLISVREAKRFFKDIEQVSIKPVRYLVNTHSHLDHIFGNAEFADRGAEIIAHEDCAATMRKTAESLLQNSASYGLTPEDMLGTQPAYPTFIFSEKIVLDLGELIVEVIGLGWSHSTGDSLVFLPQEKILFTGDVLFTDAHPFMGEGNVVKWIQVLDYILTLDIDRIIPGHGPISTKEDVIAMKEYVLQFDALGKELAAKSHDVDFIVEEMKRMLPPRAELEGLISTNIQMKYLKK